MMDQFIAGDLDQVSAPTPAIAFRRQVRSDAYDALDERERTYVNEWTDSYQDRMARLGKTVRWVDALEKLESVGWFLFSHSYPRRAARVLPEYRFRLAVSALMAFSSDLGRSWAEPVK